MASSIARPRPKPLGVGAMKPGDTSYSHGKRRSSSPTGNADPRTRSTACNSSMTGYRFSVTRSGRFFFSCRRTSRRTRADRHRCSPQSRPILGGRKESGQSDCVLKRTARKRQSQRLEQAISPVVGPLPASFADAALVGPLPASALGCPNAGPERPRATTEKRRPLPNEDM